MVTKKCQMLNTTHTAEKSYNSPHNYHTEHSTHNHTVSNNTPDTFGTRDRQDKLVLHNTQDNTNDNS